MGKREAERLDALTARADDVEVRLARLAAERASLLPFMELDAKRDMLTCLREAARIASDPALVPEMKECRPAGTRLCDEMDAAVALITYHVGSAAGERCARYITQARARRRASDQCHASDRPL